MKGQDSLEQTMREENNTTALTVLMIGRLDRLDERDYREQSDMRLAEIALDVDEYLETGRLFIP
jgi:hypothetical protein